MSKKGLIAVLVVVFALVLVLAGSLALAADKQLTPTGQEKVKTGKGDPKAKGAPLVRDKVRGTYWCLAVSYIRAPEMCAWGQVTGSKTQERACGLARQAAWNHCAASGNYPTSVMAIEKGMD